jgi:hypothetical protein
MKIITVPLFLIIPNFKTDDKSKSNVYVEWGFELFPFSTQ